MRKELQINRIKLIQEKDVEGNLKFFRTLPDGRNIEIEVDSENLVDALQGTLFQLDNFINILCNNYETPPLYYVLRDMLETVAFKIDTLCDMVEEEFGRIEVHSLNDVVPGVLDGEYLCVSGLSRHDSA